MTWLSFIHLALSALSSLTSWLRDRQLIDNATAAAMLKGYRDADEAIERARAARDLVRSELDADPGRLREPDEFERRDDIH